MKVIGFNGSPRERGNTAFMLGAILEGAKEAGAETASFHLNGLGIKPCQSCFSCKGGNPACAQKDGMAPVYAQIDSADAIVLGTPLYMWQMTAQAKVFVDRLFALFGSTGAIAEKTLVLAVNHGNPDLGMFKSYLDYTKKMFEFLGFKKVILYQVGGTQTQALSERLEAHAEMREIGAATAR